MLKRTMGTALAAAMVGAICLHLYLARFETEARGGAPQAVVSLTRDVAPGELITKAVLTQRSLPEQYVEDRHIAGADLERIVGTRVTTLLHGGTCLLWTDLDVLQAGRSLSSLVRAGMRAFSMPEGAASFDGLLRPGDRVDVLFTQRDDHDARTATILENLLVLTVGSDLGSAEQTEDSGRYEEHGVTLSVTPIQAEVLAAAEGRGRLRLSLRNPEDLVTDSLAERTQAGRDLVGASEVHHAR